MSELFIYSCILVASVFISSISQIILKVSANKTYASKLKEYFNPLVIGAYAVFFASTFITMYSLKVVPLSLSPILESSGYIFVTILGWIFLKENLSKRKLIGMSVIILGIAIFSIRL